MLYSIVLRTLVFVLSVYTCTAAECTEEELNTAKLRFKDCLEVKKAYLLQLDYEDDLDIKLLICSGLKELSTGCTEAVDEFSYCMGRDHVNHLVDIHLNAISDVLAPFHPSLELRDCPVFDTPPPIIYKKPEPEASAAAEPEYEPITGSSKAVLPSLFIITFSYMMFWI